MEGPSLFLAAEQLQPFSGKRIERVAGNSTIGIQRLEGQTVEEIFSWGKHLVFQLESFALRVHFMLWGTFAATVMGRSVTGDYRRGGPPRLVLEFPNGEITIWAASVRFVEGANVKAAYDFTADVMSDRWDGRGALVKVRAFPRAEIADVLLDQAIFAGVGNIIKNEVLFRVGVHPLTKVGALPAATLRELVEQARQYSFEFLEWKKAFVLRQHWLVHNKGICPRCNGRLKRAYLGTRERRTFYCERCQKRFRRSKAATEASYSRSSRTSH